MVLTSLELTLYTRPPYVPKTITNFLNDLSKIKNVSERLSELNDFIDKHEQELGKMEAFKRELPQSLFLVKDAIESLKEEAMEMKRSMESDQSQRAPVMDFLSLKRNSDEEQTAFLEKNSRKGKNLVDSSTQFWSPNYDKKQKTTISEPETPYHFQPCNLSDGEGVFMPFKGSSSNPATSMMAASKEGGEQDVAERSGQSCLPPAIETPRTDPGHGGSNIKGKNADMASPSLVTSNHGPDFQPKQSQQRPILKASRRCWTPELHDRFMNALELLGGSEVATPKQIRELMKVDGLTNDQVKSHLQKYRLHNRRFIETNVNLNVNPANPPVSF